MEDSLLVGLEDAKERRFGRFRSVVYIARIRIFNDAFHAREL